MSGSDLAKTPPTVGEILAVLNSAQRVHEFLVDKVTSYFQAKGHRDFTVRWDADWDGDDFSVWGRDSGFVGKVAFHKTDHRGCGCCSDDEGYVAFPLEDLLSPDFTRITLEKDRAEEEAKEARAKAEKEAQRLRDLADQEARDRETFERLSQKFGNPGFDSFRQEGGGFGQ